MNPFVQAITLNKGVLTNGSPLPGQDNVSGHIFYGTAPSLFPTSGVKQMFSVQDAINVGITGNHTDETQAIAIITLVDTGAAGNTVILTVQEPINPINANTSPNLITLCSYTKVAGDVSSATTYATNVAAAINANQAATGGYTATSALGVITLTARKGLGVYLNSGAFLVASGTDFVAGYVTITQDFGTGSGGATAGVASKIDVWFYHISEFFRTAPNSVLWVSIVSAQTTAFTEVQTLQQSAQGSIRQIAVYSQTRTVVSNIIADANALNTIAQTLDNYKMPLSVIYACDMSAVTDLTTLPNLALLSDEWVSVNISQDGSGAGWALYVATKKSITNIGALLGTVSGVSVSASIAQPIQSNNISNGTENALPVLANNAQFQAQTQGILSQLNNFRYIYSGTYIGYPGTFFNQSHCAIISNSNYAYIEQNRVEAKIERIMYAAYLPILNSQIQLNADGTIFAPLVTALESVGSQALNQQMVSQGELSAVQVVINPLQNVVNQGGLVVTLNEINNPIARTITINVNSVQSIS